MSKVFRWLIAALACVLHLQGAGADTPAVTIHFFWGDGCPHCAAAKPFLQQLTQRYPQVSVQAYEVWHTPHNLQRLQTMAAALGHQPGAVPVFLVGDQYYEGFSDTIAAQIESAVRRSLPAAPPSPDGGGADLLYLPLIGQVDLAGHSLLVATLLIAFVDGFNPCSLWVLTTLLAITLNRGSPRKMLLIGLVYISVTASVYALFIAGLFTAFSILSFVGWIQAAVALTALFFALVNIKDYFWFKEGLSFTIADEDKPRIYRGIRSLIAAGEAPWAIITATALLAAGVSLVEFSCTAGFPVLWSNLLIAQGVTLATFLLLLAVYLLVYETFDLAVFFTAVYSLNAAKLNEGHVRLLKLISGMLMLALALTMLVDPTLMNRLSTSLYIFGAAAAATLLVLALHRVVLPAMGIGIGGAAQSNQERRH